MTAELAALQKNAHNASVLGEERKSPPKLFEAPETAPGLRILMMMVCAFRRRPMSGDRDPLACIHARAIEKKKQQANETRLLLSSG